MKAIVFVISFFIASLAFGQTPKQWAKHGNEAFEEDDYYGAAYYFEKAIRADTSFLEGYWMAAESYRHFNHYEKAAERYAQVIAMDDDEDYFKAVFYLPLMQKSLMKYVLALEGFQNYTAVYRSASSSLYKRAKQEIKSCQFALENLHDSLNIEVIHPELGVNSFEGEINPFFTNDSTLYFSSLRHSDTGSKTIETPSFFSFMGVRSDSIFVLDSLFAPEGIHLGNVFVSPLRPRVYYTLCSKEEGCAIYYRDSTLHVEGLDPATRIEALEVSGYTATHPIVTVWGKKEVLLFASNRPRGRGGMDLWYSEIKDATKFSRPKNLGKTINTPGNEVTPYYDTTKQELYFSSTWHNGYGGYDIQKSNGSLRSWSAPENFGQPVNSATNDLYFNLNDSLRLLAWVSNRSGSFAKKGEHCCNDIYVGKVPVILDTLPVDTLPVDTPVVPKDSVPPVLVQAPKVAPVSVYFDNDYPDPRTKRTTSTLSLEDLFLRYNQSADSYADAQTDTASFGVFTRTNLKNGLANLDAFVEEAEAFRAFSDTIAITLRGFASPLARTDYNLNLSKRRIDAVKSYLLAQKDWAKAVDDGTIRFIDEPLGEAESSGVVNDSLSEKAKSVYSLEAMKARRVEVLLKQ